jgi:hypothetical protein
MDDGRTDGWKVSFHPDVCMESFISSRSFTTTTLPGDGRVKWWMKKISFHHDHARRPHVTTMPDHDARPRLTTTTPIFWTCWLLHHVANRETFHPFFFPSPLLHLGSMWQRVDIYSMESGDSSTNIRVYAIVSTSLKLANLCWPRNTTHYIVLIAALVLSI